MICLAVVVAGGRAEYGPCHAYSDQDQRHWIGLGLTANARQKARSDTAHAGHHLVDEMARRHLLAQAFCRINDLGPNAFSLVLEIFSRLIAHLICSFAARRSSET